MKLFKLYFILFFFIPTLFSFSKEKNPKKPILTQSQKATDCISISTLFNSNEWITSAYNECTTPEKVKKRILIVKSINTNIKNKLILDTFNLIISKRGSKIIFRARKKSLKENSILKWKLID